MAKRVFDVFLILVTLPVTLPVMGLVGLAVRLRLGRPVLYHEERLGLGGKPFRISKFRTMSEDWDEEGRLLPDAERLSRLGAFLRATSLDELPELFLVLRGEMSLVGPRPLPAVYKDLYNAHQNRRHEARPGITGLAQIRGRNALSWEDRFDFDVEYVDTRTFWSDLQILSQTVWAVVRRTGVSAEGHATMYPFTGTADPAVDEPAD